MRDSELYVLSQEQVHELFDAIDRMAAAVDCIVSNALVVPSGTQLTQDLQTSD